MQTILSMCLAVLVILIVSLTVYFDLEERAQRKELIQKVFKYNEELVNKHLHRDDNIVPFKRHILNITHYT